jgi:hypothetical protein
VIDNKDYPWSRVRVLGENTPAIEGYVSPPAFRSPIDYRAYFQRRPDGSWLMTHFIAGD